MCLRFVLPADHAADRVAAAVRREETVADRRDLDPAPSARRPATAERAARTWTGPTGPDRDLHRRDPKPAATGSAAGHPGRSCAGTATSSAAARTARSMRGEPAAERPRAGSVGPWSSGGPRDPGWGYAQDRRARAALAWSDGSGIDGVGHPRGAGSAPRRDDQVPTWPRFLAPRPRRSWRAGFYAPTCSMAPCATSLP